MEIRYGQIEDAESLALAIQNVEDSGFMLFNPGERQLTKEGAESLLKVLSKEPNAVIVAVHENRVHGYLFIKGETVSRVKHRASIAVVGVCDFARKQGIAQKMFAKAHLFAAEREIHRLQISVIATNEPAIRLYEKMGYVREGIYKDAIYMNGSYVDELVLAKLK